jgi:hypothetical protein
VAVHEDRIHWDLGLERCYFVGADLVDRNRDVEVISVLDPDREDHTLYP